MDSFWSILIVIAIVVISDQFGSKKKKVPPRPLPQPGEGQGRQKMPLPWPDIRPPAPTEPQDTEVFMEPEIYAEPEPELPVLKQPAPRRAEAVKPEPVAAAGQPCNSGLGLTPEQAVSALAWSEILGKPKACKNGHFRR